jgi:hypothetical protein
MRFLPRAALIWLALPVAGALADVRIDLRTDRTSLSLDDTLTLQISIETQGTGQPRVEMPALDGFEIVSQQVQRPMQFSFSFGAQAVVKSSTIYTFVLRPVREGTLVIKPARAEFEGQVKTTRPLEIQVGRGAGPAPDGSGEAAAADNRAARGADHGKGQDRSEIDSLAFVRAVVDKAEPYEGEQVTVTLYLYTRERLQAAPKIETEPTTDGLWTHDLLSPNNPLRPDRQMVGNDVYAVYVLRRFAAFPLRSGDVTIGPMALELDTTPFFDLFASGRARPNVKRASPPITLKVKPLPTTGRPAGEVAVGRYELSTKLDRTQAVTGDALTLTAVVRGQGNIRTVQLAAPVIPGVDVLQPETKDLVEAPSDVVSGRREYRWLLVPRQPGRIAIPTLQLATFDPRTEQYASLTSPELTVDVVGQAAAPASQPAATEPSPALPGAADDDHSWAPIRTQSALQRGYRRTAEHAWFPFAVLAPFVVWLAAVSASGVRRRLAARAESGQLRLLREAERRLQAAEHAADAGDAGRFYAHASAAVLGVLDARLEEPVAGMTRPQLHALLEARGMDPGLIGAVIQALQDCEFARFGTAPLSSSELGSQAKALAGFFRQIAGWKPREQPEAA